MRNEKEWEIEMIVSHEQVGEMIGSFAYLQQLIEAYGLFDDMRLGDMLVEKFHVDLLERE